MTWRRLVHRRVGWSGLHWQGVGRAQIEQLGVVVARNDRLGLVVTGACRTDAAPLPWRVGLDAAPRSEHERPGYGDDLDLQAAWATRPQSEPHGALLIESDRVQFLVRLLGVSVAHFVRHTGPGYWGACSAGARGAGRRRRCRPLSRRCQQGHQQPWGDCPTPDSPADPIIDDSHYMYTSWAVEVWLPRRPIERYTTHVRKWKHQAKGDRRNGSCYTILSGSSGHQPSHPPSQPAYVSGARAFFFSDFGVSARVGLQVGRRVSWHCSVVTEQAPAFRHP